MGNVSGEKMECESGKRVVCGVERKCGVYEWGESLVCLSGERVKCECGESGGCEWAEGGVFEWGESAA